MLSLQPENYLSGNRGRFARRDPTTEGESDGYR
jgi:hypothetical protein